MHCNVLNYNEILFLIIIGVVYWREIVIGEKLSGMLLS